MKVTAWIVRNPREPMVLEEREESPGAGEVIVRTAGCGVCHTDLGFYYEGVPTRAGFPLALGHEVSGTVVEAGEGAESWMEQDVVVPAVIPCGKCAACRSGHGSICAKQIFPGNDVHGGFATHLRVPAEGLCPVPDLSDPEKNPGGLELRALSVIADAVSTPYQAIRRSGLEEGDLAIFVGAGGVGGFGVQVAASRGARVIAIDPQEERLALMESHGASLCLRPDRLEFRELRAKVREFAKGSGTPSWRWKIFECSGTGAGQASAFGLLAPGSYLSIVGYTPKKTEIRLSNLMAFDATAQGNWGCIPELYPAVLDLVLSGKVSLEPFVEFRPLATINETFAELHNRKISRRVILSPEE
ncbi:MAG: 6-hydroxycyclohex-1-ene-1-carbonyl-CoA dehydrogenase [Planctomycetota bacterium]